MCWNITASAKKLEIAKIEANGGNEDDSKIIAQLVEEAKNEENADDDDDDKPDLSEVLYVTSYPPVRHRVVCLYLTPLVHSFLW